MKRAPEFQSYRLPLTRLADHVGSAPSPRFAGRGERARAARPNARQTIGKNIPRLFRPPGGRSLIVNRSCSSLVYFALLNSAGSFAYGWVCVMRFPKPGGSRAIARMLAAAFIAAGAAGCSNANRFGDNALSNPYASRREAANQAAPAEAAPLGRVEAQPLGEQSAAPLPPPGPAPSYYPPRDTTGSLAAASSSEEITITVASGDTVDAIARRYGVSSGAIVQANHLTAASSIQAGQRLVIPRHSGTRPLAAASSTSVAA